MLDDDNFYNYEKYKTFWWLVYLQYAEFVCEDPSFSARNGFDLKKYFRTKEGKLFRDKLERIAWGKS